MSICVVDGNPCRCQPQEGVPCPGVVALADALYGCFLESTGDYGTGYVCACCQEPIKVKEWTTAKHKDDCPVLIAKRISDSVTPSPPVSKGR